jgi:hypothetical protein
MDPGARPSFTDLSRSLEKLFIAQTTADEQIKAGLDSVGSSNTDAIDAIDSGHDTAKHNRAKGNRVSPASNIGASAAILKGKLTVCVASDEIVEEIEAQEKAPTLSVNHSNSSIVNFPGAQYEPVSENGSRTRASAAMNTASLVYDPVSLSAPVALCATRGVPDHGGSISSAQYESLSESKTHNAVDNGNSSFYSPMSLLPEQAPDYAVLEGTAADELPAGSEMSSTPTERGGGIYAPVTLSAQATDIPVEFPTPNTCNQAHVRTPKSPSPGSIFPQKINTVTTSI